MGKKRPPYVYFCLERQQTDPKLRGKSLPELVELCSDDWKMLSADQKARYKETANVMSEQGPEQFATFAPKASTPMQELAGKFDSLGRSFYALRAKSIQEKRYQQFARRDVLNHIGGEEVADIRYHIMTANIWLELDSTGDIIPVEIGLAEMSLRHGIMRKFVQLIDPGEVPAGFKADMKINSEKYHGIWLDNPELVDTYGEVIQTLKDILRANDEEKYAGEGLQFPIEDDGIQEPEALLSARFHRLLPIYVMPDHKRIVAGCLKWLTEQAKMEVTFPLYELDYLLQQLVLTAPYDAPTRMTQGAAEAHLSRDVYLYLPSISCRFHDEAESSKCAGARAARLAYIICDFCCQYYGIKPNEGGHLPWGISVESVVDVSFDASIRSDSSEQISYVADSVSSTYSKLADIPIMTDSAMSRVTPDGLHVLHSFLDDGADHQGKLVFKSLDQLLEADGPPPEFVFESSANNESSVFARTRDDSLNSFFEEVEKHEVHYSKFPSWNPGALKQTKGNLTDSFVTAAGFSDKL